MVWMLGLGLGCNAGIEGGGPELEPGTPAEQLQRSCESGKASDCRLLGGLYLIGNGVEADLDRAAWFYARACTASDGEACATLANLHHEGRESIERDLGKAADLYGQACDHGHVESCATLARMHVEALGVPEDAARAVELLEKACEGGHGESCSELASMYALGARVPRSPARSRRFAKQGCKAEHVPSCFQLAERQILEGDDRDARSLLEALAEKHAESDNIDHVVLYGLMVAAGEKPSRIGEPLLEAWKASEQSDQSDWSWAALTDHLRDEKRKRAKESRIVIQLLGAPRSDGTESALRAALEVPE